MNKPVENGLNLKNIRTPESGDALTGISWRDGRICAGLADELEAQSGEGRLLTPGLIDLHCHGIERWVFDCGAEDTCEIAARLPRYGVTSALPTMVPRAGEDYLAMLGNVAKTLPKCSGAHLPGLHLEGPFVALAGAACWTSPGDLGLLEELLDAARQSVVVMSISPDTPGIIPIIERLVQYRIVPFITHTRATVEQTRRALDAGAHHATHFYDVFPVPPVADAGVRPAGAVEAILADPRASVDFIPDGIHVDPVVIRMALRALGARNVLAITDSNIGAGLPDGTYPSPWGFPVCINSTRGGARIADPAHPSFDGLTGSALTLNRGVRNLLEWFSERPPAEIWNMATRNPARLLRWRKRGTLRRSAEADLVLWNEDLTPAKVWVGGKRIHLDRNDSGTPI